MEGGWIRISRWTVFVLGTASLTQMEPIWRRGAESRLLLTRVEPGQDTLSGDPQQRGVGAGPRVWPVCTCDTEVSGTGGWK